MSLISWRSSRLRRVARSSSAAETQAAADGDDEAVYIRLCLEEVLFSFIWKTGNRKQDKILAALVLDCRGVYDAQQGDVVTKDSDTARAPWELFVRRGFRWKLIHDSQNLIFAKPCKIWT